MARKRKGIPALAEALAVIATEGTTLESKADSVLAIVRTSGIRGEKEFSAAVREAYKANGWHVRAGAPKKGAAGKPVPGTVKQYVSQVRRAFRLGIPVAGMKSFFKLRKAIREAAAKKRPAVNADPKMAGLRLVKAGEMIGAPFHDLTVLYERAPRPVQRQLLGEVTSLVKRFSPAVAPQLVLAKAA